MPYGIKKNYPGCDGVAVVKTDTGKIVPGGCHPSMEKAQAHLAALKSNVEDAMLEQIGDKLYATARAYIVDNTDDLPRELASEFKRQELNPGFLWIAGRYVQGNQTNRNGQYWTFDDLQRGEASIRYTPMNMLHNWQQPIGTVVETKIVHREDREGASDRLLPEIQALGLVWEFNFPEAAKAVRQAHEAKQLWYSMECVAEAKQCLTCEQIYPWRANAHEVCEHLATSQVSPRRFINPTFLGAGLIIPPERPGWKDATITEVANLVRQYATREQTSPDADEWQLLMDLVSN